MATPTIAPSTTSTIPAPPSTIQDPEFDAIQKALADGQREYAVQLTNDAPDLNRLLLFFDKETANKSVEKILSVRAAGRRIRSGTISELVVVNVKATNLPDLKIAQTCYRNNAAETQINDPSDPNDDVLIQDDYEVLSYDAYVSNATGVWRLGRKFYTDGVTCRSLFD